MRRGYENVIPMTDQISDETPSPAFGRRALYGLLAGLLLGLLLAVLSFPLGLFDVNPDVEASMLVVMLPLLGESAAAGLIGGLMGAVSRWFSHTPVTGTAVIAGIGAAGTGALITFGLLASTLVPVAQVAWILLLGGAAAWASLRTDRHQSR